MKPIIRILMTGLLLSSFAFAGEHGEPKNTSGYSLGGNSPLGRYINSQSQEKGESSSGFNPFKYIKDQLTILPKGTGDYVAAVTDDTCNGDLKAWRSEWGIDKVIGDVTGVADLPTKLRAEGYGPNKKIGTLAISGHGGCDGEACWIKGTQSFIGSGMSDEELKNIRELLADDAVIHLMGCSTARESAGIQKLANRLGLRVVGNTGAVKSGNSWAEGTWYVFNPVK